MLLLYLLIGLFEPPAYASPIGKSVRVLLEKDHLHGQIYLSSTAVGTPGQSFTVLYNPMTQYSWMPSDDCDWKPIICDRHPKFHPEQSSSFVDLNRKLSVPYPVGFRMLPAIGNLVQERVCLDKICASGQPLILADWWSWLLWITVQDVTLGLGFPANQTDQVSILQTLYNQKKVDSRMFTIQYERNPANASLGKGELIMGQMDMSIFSSDIVYAPLSSEKKWQVVVDSVSVGDYILPYSNHTAFFDTNYPLIAGPYAAVLQLYHVLGATPYWDGHYNVSCDRVSSLPPVVFHISGHTLIFKGEDYIQKKEFVAGNEKNRTETVCEVAISGHAYPMKYLGYWAFGSMFLERYSTVFDMENHRIGFGEPKKRFY